jgi:hypothetical protein
MLTATTSTLDKATKNHSESGLHDHALDPYAPIGLFQTVVPLWVVTISV